MPDTMKGREIADAPRDGTIIIVSVMAYCGVPETGHYEFCRVIPSKLGDSWSPVGEPNYHMGKSSILGWWPDGTPEDQMHKRERTNFKYRPSNGTEGKIFYENFCARCKKERSWRESEKDPCDIFGRSLWHGIGDDEYPEELTTDKDGDPTCTAFELDAALSRQEARGQ